MLPIITMASRKQPWEGLHLDIGIFLTDWCRIDPLLLVQLQIVTSGLRRLQRVHCVVLVNVVI